MMDSMLRMSEHDEQIESMNIGKDTDLIDLSDSAEVGSTLLDFQVDNADLYAHSDGPSIPSTACEQSQQQLELIDHFDVTVEDIQFSEFREVDVDDESGEIHGGVELPDLPDLGCSRIGISETVPKDADDKLPLTELPDFADYADVEVSNDSNNEQQKLSDITPSEPLVEVTSDDEAKDKQIRIMREILQSVGDLLSDCVPGSTFIIPDSFDEVSASETVANFASIITRIGASKAAVHTTSESTVQSDAPTWLEEVSHQHQTANVPGAAEWEEVNDYQPAPDYGLESPVISHLLNTWTTDTTKIEFLRSWVRSLYMPTYDNLHYPPGLQITNLSSVLRDGFMVLLVPLIRSLSKPAVTVHVKRHLASQDRLLPLSARSVSSDSDHSPTDPFASDVLFDIRIKRLDITLPAEGYVSDNAAARQFFQSNQGANKFRVDSQYYSPLSEINSALPAIEEKTKRRVFDHAPAEDLEDMIAHSPSAPRRKSFDREYASFSRGVDSYDRGPRSVSFSMPHAPPVPQASLLDSIYSWWGAAPAPVTVPVPTPAPVSAPVLASAVAPLAPTAVSASQPAASLNTNKDGRAITPESRADSYTSLTSVSDVAASQSDSESTAAPRRSPAATPVNKIAERLQKIRVQKQQQV